MGAFFVPIYTGRIHGPYIRVVCTGYPYIQNVYMGAKSAKKCARIYGPYIRVSFWTPVNTDPQIRAIYMARIYGQYIRVVCIGFRDVDVCTGTITNWNLCNALVNKSTAVSQEMQETKFIQSTTGMSHLSYSQHCQ